MIWDCFMFAGELDILRCRLETMAAYELPHPVHHIITEAAVDNHGNAKPYTLAGSQLLRGWQGENAVTYVKVPTLPGPTAWEREHQLRDKALPMLRAHAHPGDTVLIADVDEIPARHVLTRPVTSAKTLMMKNITLTLNRALPQEMVTSVISPWPVPCGKLSMVRDGRGSHEHVYGAGWHLSWLGGPDAVEKKLAMHCHSRQELLGMTAQLVPNNDWPEWCVDNAPPSWWDAPPVT